MPRLTLKILPASSANELQSGGLKFTFFFLVVLLAAINTGNNLIYLVLSTLSGVALINFGLARLSLRNLMVETHFPDELFAGEESVVDFFVAKGRSISPAQSIGLAVRAGGEPETHLPYIDYLAQGDRTRIQGLVRWRHRGVYPLIGVDVVCNYPFGLMSSRRLYRQNRQLAVFPEILSLDELLKTGAEGLYAADSVFRGQGGGLLNIRPFLPGDDRRHMHWKASAKEDRLMVKEFAREEGRTIWVHFNPLRHGEKHKDERELFECGASVAASLAYHGRSDGLRMIFSAPGVRLVPGGNGAQVRNFFEYLAEVKPGGRLLNEQQQAPHSRRGDELAIIVDPLNSDVDWGRQTVVLDRSYMREVRRLRR